MVKLRDVQPEDRDMLREWRNLPEVSRFMSTDHYISEEEHRRWFEHAMADETRRYWIIQDGDEQLGLAHVYNIDWHHSRAEWAVYLATPNRRPGIGSYVEYEVMQYVFDDLGLNRLMCAVLDFNDRVVAMHEKFGFIREGLMRQHVRKGDSFVDVVQLGILREEWNQIRGPLHERLFPDTARRSVTE